MKDEIDSHIVYVDDEGFIEGNIAGLTELRTAIDEAIQSGYSAVTAGSGENIFGVFLSDSKRSNEIEHKSANSIGSVVLGSLAFIWFVVLPFVAIGLLIFVFFFSGNCKVKDYRSLYIQDLLKEQYFDKRD